MAQEIERKFLLPPDIVYRTWSSGRLQRQGYLQTGTDAELRIRQEGCSRTMTMKSGSGLQRKEWEVNISKKDFLHLWPDTYGKRVEKIRFRGTKAGQGWEMDVYQEQLKGLKTLELEFTSLKGARSIDLLQFPELGPELTWDPRYKNAALAETPGTNELFTLDRVDLSNLAIGVIPYLHDAEGFNLVLVTNRKGDKWIVPKGQPEEGLTWSEVALKEALEEAGLQGNLVGHPLLLPYKKDIGITNLLLFPMEVQSMATKWEEQGFRNRKVVIDREALAMGDNFIVSTAARVIQSIYCPIRV